MVPGSIRRGLLKFSFYWVAFVASCLIVFVVSALYMRVKPLQFEAPVSSLNNVFLPDVCPPNSFRSYHYSTHNLIGRSHSGSHLCRSNIEDDCHELVSRIDQRRLQIKCIQGFRCIRSAVSELGQTWHIIDSYLKRSALLDMSSPSWSAQLADQPTFRLNSTRICLEYQVFASFRTVTMLVASKQYLGVRSVVRPSSFQSYPFDVYVHFVPNCH